MCILYFLLPEKSTIMFFALRALQFWEMALVFHCHLGKFDINIFPDLKSKQIIYFTTLISLNTIPPIWVKQIECCRDWTVLI